MRLKHAFSARLAPSLGLFLTRYIVRVEPLASASVYELAELLGPAIEHIVTRQRD